MVSDSSRDSSPDSSHGVREFLRSARVSSFHDAMVEKWHVAPPSSLFGEMIPVVGEQHLRNFMLWHTEDEARRGDMPDSYIAEQKRKIDAFNQQRQDYIEKIDEEIIRIWPWVTENPTLPMNTETPGSVIDRLSISSLKMYHMREETERADASEEHKKKCGEKLEVIRRQRAELATALDQLLDELHDRRKRLQVYRQFKMYNDPTLNPAVYKNL